MARKRRKASAGKRSKKSRTAIRKTARPGVKKELWATRSRVPIAWSWTLSKAPTTCAINWSLQQLRKRSNSAADAPHSKASNVAMAIVVQRDHQCPLWVKSRHVQCKRAMSALPPKADIRGRPDTVGVLMGALMGAA